MVVDPLPCGPGVNAELAYQMMTVSRQAYQPEFEARELANRLGAEFHRLLPQLLQFVPGVDAYVFDDMVWIACQGTFNSWQWASHFLSNTSIIESEWFDGETIDYWAVCAQQQWDWVSERIGEKAKPLYLTGHSFGGVCALLHGNRINKLGLKDEVCGYMFAMPRPGSVALVNANMWAKNIMVEGDPVPLIPPKNLVDIPWWLEWYQRDVEFAQLNEKYFVNYNGYIPAPVRGDENLFVWHTYQQWREHYACSYVDYTRAVARGS